MTLTHTTDVTERDKLSLRISEELARSEPKLRIWEHVYKGGKKPKTAFAIAKDLHIPHTRVLQLATPMAAAHFFKSTKVGKLKAFEKDPSINTAKSKILRWARSKAARNKQQEKYDRSKVNVKVSLRTRNPIHVASITIDDIANFREARKVPLSGLRELKPKRLPEKLFKYGLADILGNRGIFTDWGGETDDLYSSHLFVRGRRRNAAIALKGPATAPPLTLKKMGKNANQIARLFTSTAEVFVVQFEGQVDEMIYRQMETEAIRKSKETGQTIYYCVVALEDSHRLRIAYPDSFSEDRIPQRGG
jgi:hypothetical protein